MEEPDESLQHMLKWDASPKEESVLEIRTQPMARERQEQRREQCGEHCSEQRQERRMDQRREERQDECGEHCPEMRTERRPEQRMEQKQEQPIQRREQHMQRRKMHSEDCEDGFGMLPSCAPLANPYVPMQPDNPKTYPAKKGVVRGTLFPGLDLPFMGMVNSTELSDTHLHELQALSFAIVELGEYLDTHPEDQEAFSLFQSYAALYQKGREEYEAMHGPLTQRASAAGEQYTWLNDPWPWEFAANHKKEG